MNSIPIVLFLLANVLRSETLSIPPQDVKQTSTVSDSSNALNGLSDWKLPINCIIIADSQYSDNVLDIMIFKRFVKAIGDQLYNNVTLNFKSSITFFGPFGEDNGDVTNELTEMRDKLIFEALVSDMEFAKKPLTQENLITYINKINRFPYDFYSSCLLYISATSTSAYVRNQYDFKAVVGVAFDGYKKSPVTDDPLIIADYTETSINRIVDAVISQISAPSPTTVYTTTTSYTSTTSYPSTAPYSPTTSILSTTTYPSTISTGPPVPINCIIVGDTTVDKGTVVKEQEFIRNVGDKLYQNPRVSFMSSLTYFGQNANYAGDPEQYTVMFDETIFDAVVSYTDEAIMSYDQDDSIDDLNGMTTGDLPYDKTTSCIIFFSGTATSNRLRNTEDLYHAAFGVAFGTVTTSPVTSTPIVVDLNSNADIDRVIQAVLLKFLP